MDAALFSTSTIGRLRPRWCTVRVTQQSEQATLTGHRYADFQATSWRIVGKLPTEDIAAEQLLLVNIAVGVERSEYCFGQRPLCE